MPHADELLGEPQARVMVAAFRTAAPQLDFTALDAASGNLGQLALRERVDLLSATLLEILPDNYAEFASVVRGAAESEELAGWIIWPVTEAIVARADTEIVAATSFASSNVPASNVTLVFDDAMALLAELTGRLTAEWAIRTPLKRDPARGLAIALDWTQHTDEHVRRLASEGTRPYLPWGTKVPAIFNDTSSTLPILDALYRDESEYVRRSVANHLNDISRHDPELVVATAGRWLGEPDVNTKRTVKHALRTLVKKGHPGALALLGFAPVEASVDGPVLSAQTVAIGSSIRFSAAVTNTGAEASRIAIDYVVHHAKANGTQTEKVFKLSTPELAPGETFGIERAHSFKVISTRRYYPGPHALELQVNGERFGRADFELLAE